MAYKLHCNWLQFLLPFLLFFVILLNVIFIASSIIIKQYSVDFSTHFKSTPSCFRKDSCKNRNIVHEIIIRDILFILLVN